MPTQERKKVLAVLDDLFFTVKILDAAKRAGLEVEFLKTDMDVMLRAEQQHPALIVFDLNCHSVQPLKLISKLKSAENLRDISLLGFVSHVQGELKKKAQESGCDMVMARSAFSQNLPLIFKRHAGTGGLPG